MRIVLIELVLLAIPLIVFFIAARVLSKNKSNTPLGAIGLASAVIAVIGFILVVMFITRDDTPDVEMVYLPPYLESGRLVEARQVPADQVPAEVLALPAQERGRAYDAYLARENAQDMSEPADEPPVSQDGDGDAPSR